MTQTTSSEDDQSPSSLEHVVDVIDHLGRRQQRVSIADMQQQIGERGFGPFLFLPAIVEISPIGGIPGVPTVLGIIVAIFSLQMLFGRRSLWLPRFLSQRTVDGDKLHLTLKKVRPVARYLRHVVRPRWEWATRTPFSQLVAIAGIGAAACAPPLELLPFANTVPFAGIGLLGLGLIARDGVLVVAGMALATSALGLVVWVLLF